MKITLKDILNLVDSSNIGVYHSDKILVCGNKQKIVKTVNQNRECLKVFFDGERISIEVGEV